MRLHVRLWGWSTAKNLFAADFFAYLIQNNTDTKDTGKCESACRILWNHNTETEYRFHMRGCHLPMVWMTVLSRSSSSPRAISSVFIHRIILQRDSGSPAAQPTDTFAGERDSLPAFSGAPSKRNGEEDGRGGTVATAEPAKQKRRMRKVDQPRMWRRCCCLIWFMEAGGKLCWAAREK